MRALFVMHDHVSPTGPVSQRLRERGFEVDELVVVDEAELRHTERAVRLPEPRRLRPDRADGLAVGSVG